MITVKDAELITLKEIVDIAKAIIDNPSDYEIEHVETNAGSASSKFGSADSCYNKLGFNLVYLNKSSIEKPRIV